MTRRVRTIRRWLVGSAIGGIVGLGGVVQGQVPAPEAPAVVVIGKGDPNGPAIPTEPTPVEVQPAQAAPPTAGPSVPAPASAPDNPFQNVPPPRIPPQPGFFPILPTGPGYYSLLDALSGAYRQGPPKYPYPRNAIMAPSFFDVDFRYLDEHQNTEYDYLDTLKRMRVGDNWMLSLGGQSWDRYMNEYNSRLTQQNNDYLLSRYRLYSDLWYRDTFRIFVEGISAYSYWQNLPPGPFDQNHADFQNLFFDLKLAEIGGKPVYGRVGRQELNFGSQRLISTLDWGNTRRTFQGAQLFRTSENLDVDLFWVKPVIPNATRLDSWDDKQNLAGIFTTYRPAKGHSIDAYYLYSDNRNRVDQLGVPRAPNVLNTFGGRSVGSANNFLYDFEGAMQLGSVGSSYDIAAMGVAGLGYHFQGAPLNPTFWAYYDYASGDHNPNGGTAHTFNQLFPYNHYYFGWLDLVGRQNIQDFNLHMYLYPTKWIQFQLQYHNFWLAARQDALYNAAGTAIRRDPTGQSGSHVGQELDAIVNFHVTKHSDVLTGYSYLFGGDFLRNTAGPNTAANSSLFYLMYNYRW